MCYSINEHKHIFAAWAASRAASVITCRFKVQQGKEILEKANINLLSNDINNLPCSEDFDEKHLEWRNNVISTALEYRLKFSHGIAAKLINIYLKTIYVCGSNYNDPRVRAIHPPIDRVLLDALYKHNVGNLKDEWNKARKISWSKLNSKQYYNVILAIKKVFPDNSGLWQIEKYWKGHQ